MKLRSDYLSSRFSLVEFVGNFNDAEELEA